MTKSLLQSKTFWLAAAQAALAIIVVFNTNYPSVGWLLMAKSVADIVLRLVTTSSISGVTTT